MASCKLPRSIKLIYTHINASCPNRARVWLGISPSNRNSVFLSTALPRCVYFLVTCELYLLSGTSYSFYDFYDRFDILCLSFWPVKGITHMDVKIIKKSLILIFSIFVWLLAVGAIKTKADITPTFRCCNLCYRMKQSGINQLHIVCVCACVSLCVAMATDMNCSYFIHFHRFLYLKKCFIE